MPIINDFHADYLEIIRQTRRCRPDVEASAKSLTHLPPQDWDDLIRTLIQSGEDSALGIAFNICSVNEVQLDPKIAAEALKVVEPITDFSPVYRFQNETAVPYLIKIIQSEELSTERQVYAGLIAAEMTAHYQLDPQPVRRALSKLEQSFALTPMLELYLFTGLK